MTFSKSHKVPSPSKEIAVIPVILVLFILKQFYLKSRHFTTCLRKSGGSDHFRKVTRNGHITLPASVRRNPGIEEGDLVEIQVIDEKAIIMPKKLIDTSQACFWTKKWQDGEKQAEKDIEDGRVKTFETANELFRDLDE